MTSFEASKTGNAFVSFSIFTRLGCVHSSNSSAGALCW
jgi:hypothetical protein